MIRAVYVLGICWPLVSGRSTVMQKLIQLLLEVGLGTVFEQISLYSIFSRDDRTMKQTLSRTRDITLSIILESSRNHGGIQTKRRLRGVIRRSSPSRESGHVIFCHGHTTDGGPGGTHHGGCSTPGQSLASSRPLCRDVRGGHTPDRFHIP